MKNIKFVVKVSHGGTRAPAYVQRIDRTPVQMTTNRKLALMMGRFTADDAVGYMEMRAKFPPGKGMWPAFWAMPTDGTWPPEIDVVEGQGETSSIDYLSVHWRDERSDDHEDETKYETGTDLSAEFHTYGVDWHTCRTHT